MSTQLGLLRALRGGNGDRVLGSTEFSICCRANYTKQIPDGCWKIVGVRFDDSSFHSYQQPETTIVITNIVFSCNTIQLTRMSAKGVLVKNDCLPSLLPLQHFCILNLEYSSPLLLDNLTGEELGQSNIPLPSSFGSFDSILSPPAPGDAPNKLYYVRKDSFNKLLLLEWDYVIGTSKTWQIRAVNSDIDVQSNYPSQNAMPSIPSSSRFRIFFTSYWIVIAIIPTTRHNSTFLLTIERHESLFLHHSSQLDANVITIKDLSPVVDCHITTLSSESNIEVSFITTDGFNPFYNIKRSDSLCGGGNAQKEFVGFPASDTICNDPNYATYLHVYNFDPKNPPEFQEASHHQEIVRKGTLFLTRGSDGRCLTYTRGTNPHLNVQSKGTYRYDATIYTPPCLQYGSEEWEAPCCSWFSGVTLMSHEGQDFVLVQMSSCSLDSSSQQPFMEELLVFDCESISSGPAFRYKTFEPLDINLGLSSHQGVWQAKSIKRTLY
mmetsp:Transcript_20141/g.25519  ORF Transcript_20141/g.25519 Transcript_20141/m.25519 type:complete len:493 (+) Transcript_20141:56-1534(+)